MTPSPGDARNEDVTERAVYVWGVLTISNVGIWLINDVWLMIDDNILFFGFTRPGKRLHNYGKSPFSMGKSTINRQFYFNSYVIVYQRISTLCILGTIRINLPPPTKRALWTCKTGILPAKTVHFSRCNYILPTKIRICIICPTTEKPFWCVPSRYSQMLPVSGSGGSMMVGWCWTSSSLGHHEPGEGIM